MKFLSEFAISYTLSFPIFYLVQRGGNKTTILDRKGLTPPRTSQAFEVFSNDEWGSEVAHTGSATAPSACTPRQNA